jgi:hypothetical protein
MKWPGDDRVKQQKFRILRALNYLILDKGEKKQERADFILLENLPLKWSRKMDQV